MPMLNWPYKAPTDNLNYSVDWSRWLGTDTIATSVWTTPTGINSSLQTNSATTTSIWISGGTIHTYYDFINTINTNGGQTKTATIRIYVI